MLLRDKIYHSIRDAILRCEFRPGEELREQILAERYRVSRSPIRDSLLRLEREDLVTVLPRRGYRVRPISLPDISNLFELRLLIEPACAAAASRADDAKLQTLDQFRDFIPQDGCEFTFLEYNMTFHRTVADLSGNRRLALVGLELAEQSRRFKRARGTLTEATMQEACADHNAIIAAIQAHDGETAARVSRQHVQTAWAVILGQDCDQPDRQPAAGPESG